MQSHHLIAYLTIEDEDVYAATERLIIALRDGLPPGSINVISPVNSDATPDIDKIEALRVLMATTLPEGDQRRTIGVSTAGQSGDNPMGVVLDDDGLKTFEEFTGHGDGWEMPT